MAETPRSIDVQVNKSIDVESVNLDDEQTARAAALHASRSVLMARSGPAQSAPGPHAVDLVNVAEWILTGQHPYAALLPITERRRWFRRPKMVDGDA